MVLVVVNTCQVNSVVRKSAIIGSVIVDITFYINFTFDFLLRLHFRFQRNSGTNWKQLSGKQRVLNIFSQLYVQTLLI